MHIVYMYRQKFMHQLHCAYIYIYIPLLCPQHFELTNEELWPCLLISCSPSPASLQLSLAIKHLPQLCTNLAL